VKEEKKPQLHVVRGKKKVRYSAKIFVRKEKKKDHVCRECQRHKGNCSLWEKGSSPTADIKKKKRGRKRRLRIKRGKKVPHEVAAAGKKKKEIMKWSIREEKKKRSHAGCEVCGRQRRGTCCPRKQRKHDIGMKQKGGEKQRYIS